MEATLHGFTPLRWARPAALAVRFRSEARASLRL
jgi:hypothetical protein